MPPLLIQNLTLHFDPYDYDTMSIIRSNWGVSVSWCVHITCTCGANLVTVGQQLAEIMHIIFYNDLIVPSKAGQSDLIFVV